MSKLVALSILITGCIAGEACATTWRTPSALETNILAIDGLVVFFQGTGGLTVLDAKSGQVRFRLELPTVVGYPDELLSSPAGLLVKSYKTIMLLDTKKFQPQWTIENCSGAKVDGSNLLVHDGNHTVRCHDAATGQEKWRRVIKGGWNLSLARGIAIVMVEPNYDEPSAFWAFDADSGEQLMHKVPTENEQWLRIHIGDKVLFAVMMSLERQSFEDIPIGIVKYDFAGQELKRFNMSSPQVTTEVDRRYPMMIDGVILEFDGSCRQAFPFELANKKAALQWNGYESFACSTGIVEGEDVKDSTREQAKCLKYTSDQTLWTSFLPYVKGHEWIERFCEADGKLFIGASGGQVECLDLQSGQSEWLYVFPSFRRLLSYSNTHIGAFSQSHGNRQQVLYRKGISHLGEKSGSVILPNGKVPLMWSTLTIPPYDAPIVLDPQPELRFVNYPREQRLAWLFAGACGLGLFALALTSKRLAAVPYHNQQETRSKWPANLIIVAGWILIALCLIGMLFFGRANSYCSILFWIVLLLAAFYVCIIESRISRKPLNVVPMLFVTAVMGLAVGLTMP